MVLGLFGGKPAQDKPEAAANETVLLAIDKLVLDAGTQSRAGLSEEHVKNLVEALEGGAQLPPVRVIYDGQRYLLYDGFHRVEARRRYGTTGISAIVEQGTLRDAVLKSCGANRDHGLPRTQADKRRAVERLLTDPEWGQWSDREIERMTGTSHTFVAKVRTALQPAASTGSVASERKFTNKHGQQSTMKTGNIGKKASKPEPTEPVGKAVWGGPVVKAPELFPPEAPELKGAHEEWEELKKEFGGSERKLVIGVDPGQEQSAELEKVWPGQIEVVGEDLADEALEFGHALPEAESETEAAQPDLDLDLQISDLVVWITENNSKLASALAEALQSTHTRMYASIIQAWIEAVDAVRQAFDEKDTEEE